MSGNLVTCRQCNGSPFKCICPPIRWPFLCRLFGHRWRWRYTGARHGYEWYECERCDAEKEKR